MIYNGGRYNKNWDTKKLSELGDFSRGVSKYRPRNDRRLFENGKYPLVQTGDIKDANLYVTNHSQEYGEFGLKQSKLWDAGTLCITIAANIAETALLSYPMCFPDSVVGFKSYDEQTSNMFMYYVFEYIRTAIQNSAGGSIQDNINVDYLAGLYFKIPIKEYQDKITGVLSAIDEKILLNKKINDNLSAMISDLYNHMFNKKNIPCDWVKCKLSDVVTQINTGLNPRDNFVLGNGNIKYVTVKNLTASGSIDFSNCDTVDSNARDIIHNRSDISTGDVLFASIAPLGRCFLIQNTPMDWDINESVFSIRPNKYKISSEYLYSYFMSEEFIAKAQSSSTGSIFKGIRIGTLLEMEIIVPTQEELIRFTEVTQPLFSAKQRCVDESSSLSTLRGWLLPMLMNGQATIDN